MAKKKSSFTISGRDSKGAYTRPSGSGLTKKTYTTPKKKSTSSSKKKKSRSSSSSSSSSIPPRNIQDDIVSTTITVNGKTKTWKGDPSDSAAIARWKTSYEPGYVAKIISPRDSSGKYTSDPSKTVTYISMDKVTHAKEIAIALQGESNVPTSIFDSLRKTLAGVPKTNPPTAITVTNSTEDETVARSITSAIKGKLTAAVIAMAIIVFFLLKLNETR